MAVKGADEIHASTLHSFAFKVLQQEVPRTYPK